MGEWFIFLVRSDESDYEELEMMLGCMTHEEIQMMYAYVKKHRKYKWTWPYIEEEMRSRYIG